MRQFIFLGLLLLTYILGLSAQTFTVTLTTDKPGYGEGETIQVTYNAVGHTASNWIYLVAVDPNGCASPDDVSQQCNDAVFSSPYTNVPGDDSGTVELTAPTGVPSGSQYFVRYTDESSGFETKASSSIITVVGGTAPASSSSTGAVDPSSSTGAVDPSSSTGATDPSSTGVVVDPSSTGAVDSSSSTGVEQPSSSTGVTIANPSIDYIPSSLLIGDRIPVTVQIPSTHDVTDFIALYDTANTTCDVTTDVSCWFTMRLADDLLSVAHYTNGSSTMWFDAITDRTATVFARYVSLSSGSAQEAARSTDLVITAPVRLIMPQVAVVSQLFPVAFQAPFFHSETDYISAYVMTNDVVADTEFARQSVPAGPNGWVLFNFTSLVVDDVQAIVFRYYLSNGVAVSDEQFRVNLFSRAGVCNAGCTLAGTNCTLASQCGACGAIAEADQCQDQVAPVLTVLGLLSDNTVYASIDSETTVNFIVNSTQLNAVTIIVDHLPNNAVFDGTTLKFTPAIVDAGMSYVMTAVAITASGKMSNFVTITVNIAGHACFAFGDPHVVTFDGKNYDFQGAGDFIVAQSNGAGSIPTTFSAQARFMECDAGVSCVRGVAFTENTDKIVLLFDQTSANLTVNGNRIAIFDELISTRFSYEVDHVAYGANIFSVIPLARDGVISTGVTGDYESTNSVGTLMISISRIGDLQFTLRLASTGIAFIVQAPQNARPSWILAVPSYPYVSTLYGLCGSYDGVITNEFVARVPAVGASPVVISQNLINNAVQPAVVYDGIYNYTLLNDNITPQEIYSVFGLSWRVAAEYSAFNYTSMTYADVNRDVANIKYEAVWADNTFQQAATEACNAFDMSLGMVQQCLFDMSVSNNISTTLRSIIPAANTLCLRSGACTVGMQLLSCPAMCSGRGICSDNTCKCFGNFKGLNCTEYVEVPSSSTGAEQPTSSSSTGTDSSTGSIPDSSSSSTGALPGSSSTGPSGPQGPIDAGAASSVSLSWHIMFYTVFMATVLCFALLA